MKVWNELNSSPGIRKRKLTHYKKQLLCTAIVRLDSFAASAKTRLRFPIHELAFGIPSDKIARNERALKQWQAEYSDYQCIQEALRTRSEILAGNFVEAIVAALDAGHFSRYRFAERGWQSGQKLRKAGRVNQSRAERNREVIIREATEICSRYLSQGKKYNCSGIAVEIADRHKNQRSFVKVDSIRRTLSKYRENWESQRHSQNRR